MLIYVVPHDDHVQTQGYGGLNCVPFSVRMTYDAMKLRLIVHDRGGGRSDRDLPATDISESTRGELLYSPLLLDMVPPTNRMLRSCLCLRQGAGEGYPSFRLPSLEGRMQDGCALSLRSIPHRARLLPDLAAETAILADWLSG